MYFLVGKKLYYFMYVLIVFCVYLPKQVVAGVGANVKICVNYNSKISSTSSYAVRISGINCLYNGSDGKGSPYDQIVERFKSPNSDGTIFPCNAYTLKITKQGVNCLDLGYFEDNEALFGSCRFAYKFIAYAIQSYTDSTNVSFGLEGHVGHSLGIYQNENKDKKIQLSDSDVSTTVIRL